jgi:hypothetical protein
MVGLKRRLDLEGELLKDTDRFRGGGVCGEVRVNVAKGAKFGVDVAKGRRRADGE